MNARIEKITFDKIRQSCSPFASKPPIPYSILLIEDEGSMGQVTQLLLESCGYEVDVANDGPQGIRLTRALNPNLVICDLNLPGMGGLEVLQTLRQSEVTRHVPVIFLSGFMSEEQKKVARKFGAEIFLSKPCSFEEMKQVIADCRKASSTRSESVSPPLTMALSA